MNLFEGPLYNCTGYASMVRNIVQHYFLLQPSFYLENIEGHPHKDDKIQEEMRRFMRHIPQTDLSQVKQHIKFDLSIRFRQGIRFDDARHPRKKIGYTMFEADKLPAKWIEGCKLADELWVPSQFCKTTFKDSGLTNTKVVPLGVNLENFYREKHVTTNFSFRRLLKGKKVYLSVIDFVHRKAPDLIIDSFTKAFNAQDKVVLIIKSTSNIFSESDIHRYVLDRTSKIKSTNKPLIIIYQRQLSIKQLRDLYSLSHILLAPSRNEAFGLTLLEGMACGVPAIATNFSGPIDFCTPDTTFLVQPKQWQPASSFGMPMNLYRDCNFMEPDIDDLISVLRYSYRQVSVVKQKREKGLEHCKDWTWTNTAKIINEELNG